MHSIKECEGQNLTKGKEKLVAGTIDMAIHKSIQYSIFCENWETCGNIEDYQDLKEMGIKSPQRYFEKLGYKKIDENWYCKECIKGK